MCNTSRQKIKSLSREIKDLSKWKKIPCLYVHGWKIQHHKNVSSPPVGRDSMQSEQKFQQVLCMCTFTS